MQHDDNKNGKSFPILKKEKVRILWIPDSICLISVSGTSIVAVRNEAPSATKKHLMEMIVAGLYPGGRNFPGYPGGNALLAAGANDGDDDDGEGPDVLA